MMPDFIINAILFLFQFESFGYGEMSVSRVLLFPLLCLYLLLHRKLCIKWSSSLIIVVICLLVMMISSVGNLNFKSFFSIVFQFLILFVFLDYFFRNKGMKMSNFVILSLYDIPSIVSFVLTFSGFDIFDRFKGIYWDPNVMSVYVLISFSAKINLLNKKMKLIYRMIIYFLLPFDFILIFAASSRAAFLTTFIIIMVLILRYSKKYFAIIFGISTFLVIYLYINSIDLVWSQNMSVFDSLSYRLFSSTAEELDNPEIGSRSQRIALLFYYLNNNYISILGNATNYLPDGSYIHNGVFEFLLVLGLPFGSIFIAIFMCLVYKVIICSVFARRINLSVILLISFFMSAVFYSYFSYKIFWFFLALMIYMNYKFDSVKSYL